MFDRCEACPVVEGACWPRRANVGRLCELPEFASQVAAWGDVGEPGGESVTPGVALVMVGWPACVHRSHRGCCGDTTATCALGHGQAGIVDEPDCRGCPDQTTTPADPS